MFGELHAQQLDVKSVKASHQRSLDVVFILWSHQYLEFIFCVEFAGSVCICSIVSTCILLTTKINIVVYC